MSETGESLSHEEYVEVYLKDISLHMRYVAEILKDAFNSEIELQNIQTLEDGEDVD
tara:strand:- start:1732 stop:1899 length:168 start_codon:yes stop_codon:yes gene_type:complete